MARPRLSPHLHAQAISAVSEYGNVTAAAAALGIPRTTLNDRLRGSGIKLTKPPKSAKTPGKIPVPAGLSDGKFETRQDGKGLTIDSVSSKIKTVEDALEHGQVDTETWEVERFSVNSWEVAMKMGEEPKQYVEVTTLWQVKVWLTRRVRKYAIDVAKALLDRMAKHSFKYPTIQRKRVKDPYMLEVSLFDAHFGKLAWAAETGENYDLNIARTIYQQAVVDLLEKSSAFQLEKILFPIGQDFFHVNNAQNTTARGTPQDCDQRWAKIFETGCNALIDAIDHCLKTTKVEIVWVPGNHDRETSWYLAKFLEAWYHKHRDVTVDTVPKTRKYRRYGINLIGFTHGDEERHRDLPTIMAAEVPDLWAATTCRHWHLGHFHKRNETYHHAADTFNGIEVRVLPSLSGTDAWHYRQGYVKTSRAAEAYLWHPTHGYAAHFNAYANLTSSE